MDVIAVANHKGGVGKSATVHALGACLAGDHGLRVLVLDLDPQASLTQAVGVPSAAGRSLAEVLGGSQPGPLALADVLLPIADNLTLAPADIALATSELGLTARLGREGVLRRALRSVADGFDLALLDTAPSLGLLSISALVAADAVIIPTQPQAADLRGLRLFLDSVATIRRELNRGLEVLGVVITHYDARLVHHRAAIEAMQEAGLPMFRTRVGRSIRIAEAAGAGQPVTDFAPENPRAQEYRRFTREVAEWLKRQKD